MSVFSRLTDIINANVNAILDQAEDPEKMLKLITQEMEETLVELRTQSARCLADRKHLQKKLSFHKERLSNWEEKAELAVSRSRDDLAKAALRERAVHAQETERLQTQMSSIDDNLFKLQADTRSLEDKLKNAKARRDALLVRGRTVETRIKAKAPNVEHAMEKFAHYERRIDEMEGEVEAMTLGNTSLSEQITALADDQALDDELNELKQRLRPSTVS